MALLTFDNAKTIKGESKQYTTAIMYLSPSNTSGTNVCPFASPGCIKACLYTAGRGVMRPVQAARLARTKLWLDNRTEFLSQLKVEIVKAKKSAERKGFTLCVRLNGTSDIAWESITDVIQSFPDIQFYDYTKNPFRFKKQLPTNYHLTFSLSEVNTEQAKQVLDLGGNVAVVFDKTLPSEYLGKPVINGDETDLRFLDAKGVIVGLKAKGRAKKDDTGFVIRGCV